MRSVLAMVAAAVVAVSVLASAQVVAGDQIVTAAIEMPAVAADGPTLSVLTYNVEGLPAPLAWGRKAAADRIAARLAALRDVGQQPHIVVLQEAFGAAQRAIGAKAGYRYVAFGPDAGLANDEPMGVDDRAFAAGASILKGEREGKWAGSGLAILSDYPIVAVRRAAFPAWACAGYDCLANKGVLMASVAVPGSVQPVAVIATHMNSKNASGVSQARWNGAFDRQVATIGRFLHANLAADAPYVFAGDTNIGRSPIRTGRFESMLAGLPRATDAGIVRTAMRTCLASADACAIGAPKDVALSARRNKDWQVYAAGALTALKPLAIGVPFGRDAAGRMLSDHVGYTALYRLAAVAKPAAAGTLLALR